MHDRYACVCSSGPQFYAVIGIQGPTYIIHSVFWLDDRHAGSCADGNTSLDLYTAKYDAIL